MKILVAHASRMGSTAEIAQRIADQLREAGHEVDVSPCSDAPNADRYAAVIIGSALYIGRWERSALAYLTAQTAHLAGRPTWLFQSGPCGEVLDKEPTKTPRAVLRLTQRMNLPPPVTFGGRLDPLRAKTRLARWMAKSAYAGDYRDWDQVRSWTEKILVQLQPDHPDVPSRL